MAYKRTTKNFNLDDYHSADPVAKDIIVRMLNQQGIFAMAHEDKWADVKALVPVYHEAEIKSGWTGKWPERFKTVDIPYRKRRLITKHKGTELWFWVISGDLKHAWKVHSLELTAKRKGTKWTTRSNDDFFQIPVDCCELINLEEILSG